VHNFDIGINVADAGNGSGVVIVTRCLAPARAMTSALAAIWMPILVLAYGGHQSNG